MASTLALHVTCQGEVCIVHAAGKLDVSTGPELAACIQAAAHHHARIELDLTATTFIDSSGTKCLVDAHRAAQANDVSLAIVAASPQVDQLLRVAGLTPALDTTTD